MLPNEERALEYSYQYSKAPAPDVNEEFLQVHPQTWLGADSLSELINNTSSRQFKKMDLNDYVNDHLHIILAIALIFIFILIISIIVAIILWIYVTKCGVKRAVHEVIPMTTIAQVSPVLETIAVTQPLIRTVIQPRSQRSSTVRYSRVPSVAPVRINEEEMQNVSLDF